MPLTYLGIIFACQKIEGVPAHLCSILFHAEERRIIEETYRKRLELEEEERQRKKQEKLDQERERQRQKELERKKKEEAEERAHQRAKQAEEVRTDQVKKTVKDSAESKLLEWKQLQEEKKARLVGITESHEGQPLDIKEAEPSRNATPPAQASATTPSGQVEETFVVVSTLAEGIVTPACTEKRPSKYADIASYELTPAEKVGGCSFFREFDVC